MQPLVPALLILLMPGGGNDLLDYVPTATYWRVVGVEPTVSNLIEAARPDAPESRPAEPREPTTPSRKAFQSEQRRAAAIRRLMAIRTLGEMRAREALPVLRASLASNELFVAEYARAAIAAIQGEPFSRTPLNTVQIRKDPWRLPADCGAVAQIAYPGGAPVPLERVFELVPGLEDLDAGDQARLLEEMSEQALFAARNIGNARIESLTVGVSGHWGEHGGWVVLIARGLYDSEAIRDILRTSIREAFPNERERFAHFLSNPPYRYVGDQEVILLPLSPFVSTAIFLPSDRCFVLIVGAGNQVLPIHEVVAALRRERGTLDQNEALAALVRSLDTSQPFWAAATVTPSYRKVSLLAPFDTVTLASKAGDRQTDVTLRAQGRDAGQVAAVTQRLSAMIAEARSSWRQRRPRVTEAFLPLDAMLGGIELQTEGGELRAEVTVPDAIFKAAPLVPFLDLGGEGPVAWERQYQASVKPTAHVFGSVTVDGRPLKQGLILFIPYTDVGGPAAVGTVTNGKFSDVTTYRRFPGSGARLGRCKVLIHAPPEADAGAVPRQYTNVRKTPLEVLVKEGQNMFVLELKSEPDE